MKIWSRVQTIPFWRIMNMITQSQGLSIIKMRALFLEIRSLKTPRGTMSQNAMSHSPHARTGNMMSLMSLKMWRRAQRIRSTGLVFQKRVQLMMSRYRRGLSSIAFRITTQWNLTPRSLRAASPTTNLNSQKTWAATKAWEAGLNHRISTCQRTACLKSSEYQQMALTW